MIAALERLRITDLSNTPTSGQLCIKAQRASNTCPCSPWRPSRSGNLIPQPGPLQHSALPPPDEIPGKSRSFSRQVQSLSSTGTLCYWKDANPEARARSPLAGLFCSSASRGLSFTPTQSTLDQCRSRSWRVLGPQISFLKERVCIKSLKETDSPNSSCSCNLPFVFCRWQKTWFPGPNRCF